MYKIIRYMWEDEKYKNEEDEVKVEIANFEICIQIKVSKLISMLEKQTQELSTLWAPQATCFQGTLCLGYF